jgi:hypothetical protein
MCHEGFEKNKSGQIGNVAFLPRNRPSSKRMKHEALAPGGLTVTMMMMECCDGHFLFEALKSLSLVLINRSKLLTTLLLINRSERLIGASSSSEASRS